MKLKIKVLKVNPSIITPEIIKKGDWVDLRCAETTKLKAPKALTLKRNKENDYRKVVFEYSIIPLGIAMELPKGFEAIVAPRSSIYTNFGIMCPNSIGVIDNSYSGNEDEWKFPAIALKETTIHEGERIAQFRIQLSQKASFIQKLKWLFSTGIEIKVVDNLNNNNRGGIGSTGKK